MRTFIKNALLAGLICTATMSVAAETPEDKAYMHEFFQLTRSSLRLSAKGDADGLKEIATALRPLTERRNISPPCVETVRAKIAQLEANVSYLHAEEGTEEQAFAEFMKYVNLTHKHQAKCLSSRGGAK